MITQAQIEAAALAIYHNAGSPTEVLARAALTAAAEVGEPYICALQTGKSGKRCIGWDNAIERCAQVAETFGGHNVPLIAAAIRALKEEG